MKNVIAIAAGVVEGLGLGQNALAALITRGLAEIARLACAAGGQQETTAGLSGLGDLVLTCTGTLSRNRHVGIELARGRRLQDVLAGMKMIAEGVNTTRAALALGTRYGVELPIAIQMAAVLDGRSDVRIGGRGVDAAPPARRSRGAVGERRRCRRVLRSAFFVLRASVLVLRSAFGVLENGERRTSERRAPTQSPRLPGADKILSMGVFGRLRESLSRTKQQIIERFDEIVQLCRRAGATLASD